MLEACGNLKPQNTSMAFHRMWHIYDVLFKFLSRNYGIFYHEKDEAFVNLWTLTGLDPVCKKIALYFETVAVDVTHNRSCCCSRPTDPVQFIISSLLHIDLAPIGSKVISIWSPADLNKQMERNVLFVSADVCGGGRLCDKPKENLSPCHIEMDSSSQVQWK